MLEEKVKKLFPENTGFGQALRLSAQRFPDKTAVVAGGRRISYKELNDSSDRLAAALKRDGISFGDNVAIISRNCMEYLLIEYALYKMGAVSVKINWRSSAEDILYFLHFNDCKFVFMRTEKKDVAAAVEADLKSISVPLIYLDDESGESQFDRYLENAPAKEAFTPVEIRDDDILLKIQTSGTTGRPKTVMHTHGGFMREIAAANEVMQYSDKSVYQMVSQLFHVACIGAYILLSVGGTVVSLNKFEINNFFESLKNENINGFGAIPAVLKTVLEYPNIDKYDISSIARVSYSTSPMPIALLKESLEVLGHDTRFYQSYGMTEMGSIVTILRPEDHHKDGGKYLSSVGTPIEGVELKIVDDEGNELPRGQVGEIYIKGPCMMKGYYHADPEVTRKAFNNGWYCSKDMGRIDEDGYLYLCGRKDDMIISGGENIFPMEIINVLMRLLDDVQEAAVYGIPDPKWGERVKASVVLKKNSTMTVEDLDEYCRKNIPSYKRPRVIEILDELPKNPSGKVIIKQLKNR